jgi:UDP-N-acetylmuramate--alanine ligase
MYNSFMQTLDFPEVKKVHFIGIGGIGISAIARMMMLEGKEVSGSDRGASLVTDELAKLGVKIYLEQKAENIPDDTELIIYTIAIPEDNPEFVRAKSLGVPMLTYPEALGLVSSLKYTIAVSGTHGKTTTTAMLAKIFMDANLDPTVVVGSMLIDQHSNLIAGQGKYFITEACEYRRSFLNLNPQAVIITNIDNDHLDYYKDLADIQSAFVSLVEKIPTDGYLVCDMNDPALAPVLAVAKCEVLDYPAYSKTIASLKMKQPGEHIKKDASSAFAIAQALGIEKDSILKSLADFAGTWRRFEYKGKTEKGALVYDDYAHHPTEIKATLAGARQVVGEEKKMIVAFQPHLYSRTKLLLEEFATAFGDADIVVLPDIYAAREEDDGSISSQILAEKIKENGVEAKYFSDRNELKNFLAMSDEGDLVITMGAGDLFKTGEELVK